MKKINRHTFFFNSSPIDKKRMLWVPTIVDLVAMIRAVGRTMERNMVIFGGIRCDCEFEYLLVVSYSFVCGL